MNSFWPSLVTFPDTETHLGLPFGSPKTLPG